MNRRTLSLLVIAGLTVPILGGITASQLQAQVGEGPRGDRAEQLIEDLNLTDDQAAQLRAIRDGEREAMRALHDNLRAERDTLHDLMAGTAAETELRAQYEVVQSLHREVADQRFENMLAIRDVLTPEQRTEIAEQMEQHRAALRERFQEGFEGPRRQEGFEGPRRQDFEVPRRRGGE